MKYVNTFLMAAVSFLAMYILMYVMVNNYANVYSNLNQFYMAALMTVAMIIIELFLMRSMYSNKKVHYSIIGFNFIAFVLLITFIRNQTAITDTEFLRSMIPHHASALLMCEKAQLQDPELKELCRNITASQQAEIDFMKAKLESKSTLAK
jgi:Domain of unknown function (DUF305)